MKGVELEYTYLDCPNKDCKESAKGVRAMKSGILVLDAAMICPDLHVHVLDQDAGWVQVDTSDIDRLEED